MTENEHNLIKLRVGSAGKQHSSVGKQEAFDAAYF